LNVQVNNSVVMIQNVVGKIIGTEEPDRVIVMGAHRDGTFQK